MGGERIMTRTTHTHYDPYGPPVRAAGSLLNCADTKAHDPSGSEIFAPYMYCPRLVPSECTGLPPEDEREVLAAFMVNRDPSVRPVITDALLSDEYGVEIRISIRNMADAWHTETWARHADGQWRSTYNPHPGYEHWPAWCPNCGY